VFGFRRKAATDQPRRGGWFHVHEPFAGAWQQNKEEKRGDLLSYPTLYACLSRISSDIGQLPFQLSKLQPTGVKGETSSAAYTPVLERPNGYQTPQQFREAWLLSKLTHGNTYVLKERDRRNVVVALYVLDPFHVMPLVSENGDVFYRLDYGTGANLLPDDYPDKQLTIPASEIMHDRMNCFHHQLIGVPPLVAAYWPAAKNLKILRSSATFFDNQGQPGGILTAPAGMSQKDADAIKEYWSTNYGGDNSGRVAVIGADMKFTAFAMKSVDSQMVEQMKYSDQQICQPFGIPPFIVGVGGLPAGLKVDDMANIYYRFSLQTHVEAMETLLTRGLGVSSPLSVQLDTYALLRMDTQKRATVFGGLTGSGIATPNEARKEFNLSPLDGGDTVYMQQQDIPLSVAAQQTLPEPEPAQPDVTDDAIKQFDEAWAA